MISYLTILLFFLYIWGSGFTALSLIKKQEQQKPVHVFEKFILSLGIGLGVFPLLSILLNFLRVPLDWKIFLLLSLVYPLFFLAKKVKAKEIRLPGLSEYSFRYSFTKSTFTKSNFIFAGVLLIFFISLFVYLKGSFSYPYLEDEDPWGHAVGAKYVALEKTAYDPLLHTKQQNQIDPVLSYIDPYPPAYDILMGILHQTSPDLSWTLKFFNALLISLGFLFFFVFAKEFMGSQTKALGATFILASLPAYLSHFIWAHTLAVTLFFPTAYAFLRIKEDKRWSLLAAVLLGSLWVSQNVEQPLKATVMLIIFIFVTGMISGSFPRYQFFALVGGIGSSFLWWGKMISKYGLKEFIHYFRGLPAATVPGVQSSSVNMFFEKIASLLHSFTSSGGSGSRAYSFNDFFFARGENMINNPIGIGVVVSLLVLLGVVFLLWHYRSSLVQEKNLWRCSALFWLIFAFWGVNGQTFPLSIVRGPFRMWMWLAIAVAIIAVEGISCLLYLARKTSVPKFLILFLIVGGVLFTSAYQKYQVNTSIWPTSGSFSHPTEAFAYAEWFKTIPFNSKVFLYAPRDKLVIGYGGQSCLWCQEVYDFRTVQLEQDAGKLTSFLKSQGYQYLVLNQAMDFRYLSKTFGEEKTKELLPQRYNEIISSGLFAPVYQKEQLFVVLKLNS